MLGSSTKEAAGSLHAGVASKSGGRNGPVRVSENCAGRTKGKGAAFTLESPHLTIDSPFSSIEHVECQRRFCELFPHAFWEVGEYSRLIGVNRAEMVAV